MKYFIYARKSSESEDRQTLSIESQLRELDEVTKRLNLEIADTLFESRSAKKTGREKFAELLSKIENGAGDGILTWHPDRLSRNPKDSAEIIDLIDRGKLVAVQTPSQRFINNPMDKFMLGFFMMQAKFDNDHKGENVKVGLKTKAEKGWLPSGAKPGYMNDKFAEKGSKTWLNDPVRFPLIKKCWELMLTGAYNPPEILRKLNSEWNYRTPRHKRIGGKPFGRSAIYRMFIDPFYYGEFEYPTGSGNWYQGGHTPMITKEEFDRVQILLGRRGSRRPKKHLFWGTGCMRCGECGAMITAEEKWQIICPVCKVKFASSNRDSCPKCQTRTSEMKNPTLLHYIYYHCTKRVSPKCTQKWMQSKDVNKQIDTMLSKIQISEKFKNWAIKHLNDLNTREIGQRNASLEALNEAYSDVVGRIDNLVKLKISPQNTNNELLDDSEFRSQKEALLKEKNQLEEKQKGIGDRISKWLELSEKTFNFACYARYWFEKGTPEQKREIFLGLGSNLKIFEKIVRVDLEKPLEWIKDATEDVPEIMPKFEPKELANNTEQLEYVFSQNPSLLRRQDSNLRSSP